MTHHYIKVDIEGSVASIVLNRPNVLNAFHSEAMEPPPLENALFSPN